MNKVPIDFSTELLHTGHSSIDQVINVKVYKNKTHIVVKIADQH